MIEIMQSERSGYRIEQVGVGDRNRNNMRDIEFEEIDIVQDFVFVCISNQNENEEWDREKVENGGGDGRVAAGIGSRHCVDTRTRA